MDRYKLIETEKTEQFYQEIKLMADKLIVVENYPDVKAVARALYDRAGMGGYFWRSVIGGKFEIQDVINKGPNCIDYSEAIKNILRKKFNIDGQIKQIKLVLVNNHQYYLTSRGEVLDLLVGIVEYPEGYFETEKIYLDELKKINSQGIEIVWQQIKAILFPQIRKKL